VVRGGRLTVTREDLDVAVGLIVEAHGRELAREAFDEVARGLLPTLGLLDRAWARYLLAVRGSSYPEPSR
jgi:hypothetical protein